MQTDDVDTARTVYRGQSWIGGGDRRDVAGGIRRGRLSGLRTGWDLRRALATRAEFGRRRAREGAR
jgi:hypothetical protein